MTDLNALAADIHKTASDKGWWDRDRSFGEVIALIHSEASEALEEYRNDRGMVEVYSNAYSFNGAPKPEGVPIEFADIIIRVLDAAAHYGIDIETAVRMKMEYNTTRPYRHGGKLA